LTYRNKQTIIINEKEAETRYSPTTKYHEKILELTIRMAKKIKALQFDLFFSASKPLEYALKRLNTSLVAVLLDSATISQVNTTAVVTTRTWKKYGFRFIHSDASNEKRANSSQLLSRIINILA
jgi:hypothetical protein